MRSRMYYGERMKYKAMNPLARLVYRIRRLFW